MGYPSRLTAVSLVIGLFSALMRGVAPTALAQSRCAATYAIADGNTLSSIAAACGTTVAAILKANPAVSNPDYIRAGDTLTIPDPAASDLATSYIVAPGDALNVIAARFNTTVDELLAANPAIANPDVIFPGQYLAIPAPATETQPVTIYMIGPKSGEPAGQAMVCGDSVVPVEVSIAKTSTPVHDSLKHLLDLRYTFDEQTGLYNPLARSNLALESAQVVGNHATVKLAGRIYSDSLCEAPMIIAQIEQTARQFTGIKHVTVMINGQPLH